uniref:Beta_helix domain-containing protein n=1 Tax=Anisakis simplex TaxID=6269 RepID=A0A0M3J6M7_ANISI
LTSVSNDLNGIVLNGSVDLNINRAKVLSNRNDGIVTSLDADSSVQISDSVVANNGNAGLRALPAERTRFKIIATNFTAHHNGEAIVAMKQTKLDLSVDNCNFWMNNVGVITLNEMFKCDLRISRCNFTRNKGTTLSIKRFHSATNIQVTENRFAYNQLHKTNILNAVVDMETLEDGSRVHINDNAFVRNTMENIVRIMNSDVVTGQSTPTQVSFSSNTLLANLAVDVMLISVPNANITQNRFEDVQAQCELKTGFKMGNALISAPNNFWGTDKEIEVKTIINFFVPELKTAFTFRDCSLWKCDCH